MNYLMGSKRPENTINYSPKFFYVMELVQLTSKLKLKSRYLLLKILVTPNPLHLNFIPSQ